MEHMREHQNLRTTTQLMDTQFLKTVTQLLLSVSVFSFLFSHQSLLSFLHYLNFYLAKFPYQLVTHTVDKNCIFLLCNGLLVFLAKYSGLIRFLSRGSNRHDHDQSFITTITDVSPPEPSMPETKEVILVEKEIAEEGNNIGSEEDNFPEESTPDECMAINQQLNTETEKEIVEDVKVQRVEEEEEYQVKEFEEEEADHIYVAEDVEKQKWSSGGFFVEQTMEEEEEEGNAKLSTEELNKKFDEFIRRMKAEIRIEAQRHLIMV